jgi:hypothetical protein
MHEINEYLSNKRPITTHRLKLKLIEEGLKEHKCENCENGEWMGLPIPIELHHLDGSGDNNLENLQILCPNCHAQTHNYKGKNRRSLQHEFSEEILTSSINKSFSVTEVLRNLNVHRSPKIRKEISELINNGKASLLKKPQKIKKERRQKTTNFCQCGKELKSNRAKSCCECYQLKQRRVERPNKEILKHLIWEKPTTKIAKDYGVTDNSISKWCKHYGISKPPRGYWAKQK